MQLTKAQVKEYLTCWMDNFSPSGDAATIVGEAFACDAALVQWGFKQDRYDDYPDFNFDYAVKVVRKYL